MSISPPVDDVRVVSNQAEFEAAYAEIAAGQGGTILLEAGDAYALRAYDRHNETDAPVTIRSADPDAPAEIASVRLNGAENLTIEDVRMHMDGDDTTHSDILLRVTNSTNITVRNTDMTSDASGPVGTVDGFGQAAQAALVRNSTGVTFEGNDVSAFNHAFAFLDSYDIAVLDNELTALQGDGIRLGGVTGALVEGNHIHDLIGATQQANHSDMIQIWGSNITVNNADITIRENFLDTGNGATYQMIFGHNEQFDENGFVFSNILIEGNVLFGAHGNAISIGNTDQTTVQFNTVIHNPDAYHIFDDGTTATSDLSNRIAIGGTNATITNNISQVIIDGLDNTTLTALSPYLSSDYSSHFVNVEAGGSGDLRDLMLLSDSALNGTMGSWLTWSTEVADTLTAVADVTIAAHDLSVVTLDAGLSRGPDGYVVPQGAAVTWVFDDGTTADGARITHDFGTAGVHGYTLIVTLPDGSTDQIARTIEIASPIAAALDFGTVAVNTAGDAGPVTLHGATLADGWATIGGRDRIEIGRENDALFNLNGFNIGLTVDAEPGSAGTLLDLPRTFEAVIEDDGHMRISLTTLEGTFTLRSDVPVFGDTGAHQLNILYDGAAGTLSLVVDGVGVGSVDAFGTTPPRAYWGLTIGDAWHDAVEARVSDVYVLREPIPYDAAVEATHGPAEPQSLTIVASDVQSGAVTVSDTAMVSDSGFDLSAGTVSVMDAVDVLGGAPAFTIGFDMAPATPLQAATILSLGELLELTIDETGQFQVLLDTGTAQSSLVTAPLTLAPGVPVHVDLLVDGTGGAVQVMVDGTLVAHGTATGAISVTAADTLVFGGAEGAGVIVDNIAVEDTATLVDAPLDTLLCVRDTDGFSLADTGLKFNFEGLTQTEHATGSDSFDFRGPDVRVIEDGQAGDHVLELADGSSARLVEDDAALFELDAFVFGLNMRSDTADGRGVIGIHQSFRLDVEDDDLVFWIETSEGRFTVATEGDVLADRDWHGIEIAYSNENNSLAIVLDGQEVASTYASGTTAEEAHWGLDLGFRWGGGFDGAIDDLTFVTTPALDGEPWV